ncbi:hypothetical protein E4582_09675 [Luteimonas yindakuii]|uniref:TonB C-terminal domain-containing protein n=1 Tax=Luteimonas yindakuii TaxID=2565782 RepID=A0A4Z1RFQ4_9GAMM|nr:hypothetical protein [Luteimonas yindakuii]TKS55003.1 hypothetical protein E4582_09675 [Luteimonas yindakuii]
MKTMLAVACGAMLAAAAPAPAPARQADTPLAFTTMVKVAVDEAGRPGAVEAMAPLPGPVRDFVEARTRELEFQPAMIDGHARGGVTYVVMGVCAIPDGGQMRMAAEYRNNGPGRAGGVPYPDPPRYPVDALKRGWGADMTIRYTVGEDGSATLDKVDFNGEGQRGKGIFERMAREWVGGMRLLPEEVDGQPVSTPVSMPLELTVGRSGTRAAREMLEAARRSWVDQPECLAAERPSGQAVAAQSPFVVREADAG